MPFYAVLETFMRGFDTLVVFQRQIIVIDNQFQEVLFSHTAQAVQRLGMELQIVKIRTLLANAGTRCGGNFEVQG